MKSVFSTLFFLLILSLASAQEIPIDKSTNKHVYTDIITLDTLNVKKAFANTIHRFKSKNLTIDNERLILKFSSQTTIGFKSDNYFGKVHYDVVLRFFPNKFAYRVSNFQFFSENDFKQCGIIDLELQNPKCFRGVNARLWTKIKEETARNMGDFGLALFHVVLKNQPTEEVLKKSKSMSF